MKLCVILIPIKAEIENHLERRIKRLRSDRGGEYFSGDFSDFCVEHAIIHKRTLPYSPQSNAVAERKNRTLTDLVNAMLKTSGLSHPGFRGTKHGRELHQVCWDQVSHI
jgi:transposase InsO family protein